MWDQVGQTLNQSTLRILSRFASLLPGVVALVVAVLLSVLIAWLVVALLGRFLRRVRFDDWLERGGLKGIAEWSPGQSPTVLVTRIAGWIVILMGFVLGLAALESTLTSGLALDLFGYLPNVLAAAALMFVGAIVARYVARNVLIGGVNMNLRYARLLSIGVKWMVMVLTIAMALDRLGIGADIVHLAFGILFGGIVLALALAVGLGSKDLVTRSLERESGRSAASDPEELIRHL